MKIVKGIYAEAKRFTDDVEAYAEAQVKMICDNEVADGSKICMMPDIHPRKSWPNRIIHDSNRESNPTAFGGGYRLRNDLRKIKQE